MTRTLYLFCSAAPPVFDVARVIEAAQSRGWDVCLGLTPTAAGWLAQSLDGLAVLTGHPVRWQYPHPAEADTWPRADAVLLAPATFHTVNAWAQGLTDRYVVGVVAEGLGAGLPMVAVPCLNEALARHPQFDRSVALLRTAGAQLLYGEEVPRAAQGAAEPPAGSPQVFPWEAALDAVDAKVPAG
ncbi:flavoprotein [Streptomyces sp. NPDC097619]|uniref:flavoprotein n=1 Tax=Streptomyces sp. NPDC097619 TaxID=3157228 RepID=UPI0033282B11